MELSSRRDGSEAGKSLRGQFASEPVGKTEEQARSNWIELDCHSVSHPSVVHMRPGPRVEWNDV